jgi:hypothetical protein
LPTPSLCKPPLSQAIFPNVQCYRTEFFRQAHFHILELTRSCGHLLTYEEVIRNAKNTSTIPAGLSPTDRHTKWIRRDSESHTIGLMLHQLWYASPPDDHGMRCRDVHRMRESLCEILSSHGKWSHRRSISIENKKHQRS